MSCAGAARTIWLFTFAVFLGAGVGMVWWPASQTIAQLRTASAGYYDETARNEEEVSRAAQLHALQRKVVADLRELTPSHTPPAATAAMLQLLAAEQKAYNVTIRSVVPAQSPPGASPQRTATGPLDESPLEIDLTGRFADVLRFVADIPRHNALVEVRDISLTDSDAASASPTLSVTLHATLYRFRGEIPQEENDATGSV